MGSSTSQISKFRIPSDIDPPTDWCVLLRIPGSIDHLNMLMGLVQTLEWQKFYIKHPSEPQATLTSRRWAQALESRNPVVFENCEDAIMSFDMRVKPGEPWVTQVTTDGGATWHDAIIQPNWSAISPTITLPDTPNAAPDLSTQIIRWGRGVIQTINDGIADGEPKAQTVSRVVDSLSQYQAGGSIAPWVEKIYDAAVDNPTDAADAAGEDCFHFDMWAAIKSGIEGAGAQLYYNLGQVFEHTDTIVTTDIANALYNLAGFLGAAAVRDISMATYPDVTGENFGEDCVSTYVIDFLATDGGFETFVDLPSFPAPAGSWTVDLGWDADTLVVDEYKFHIRRAFDSVSYITKIRTTWHNYNTGSSPTCVGHSFEDSFPVEFGSDYEQTADVFTSLDQISFTGDQITDTFFHGFFIERAEFDYVGPPPWDA